MATPPETPMTSNAVCGAMPFPTPAADSTAFGPATSSVSERREVANVAGRIPLEQPPPRDQHAHDRAANRIETEQCLVGQTHEGKCHLSAAQAGRANGIREVLPKQHIAWLAKKLHHGCAKKRNEDDSDHCQVPEPSRRQYGPARQKQER